VSSDGILEALGRPETTPLFLESVDSKETYVAQEVRKSEASVGKARDKSEAMTRRDDISETYGTIEIYVWQ